ncbi:hypothetical protein N7535_007112 [Penicillium sp. DV-2018c]|nr:hypothetical protein N7461_006793 [Penicillium sp. DV-2018c]KAJ5567806.1 hypothetical protein N7535_007112 [Penicillium sp. DV-2018c]
MDDGAKLQLAERPHGRWLRARQEERHSPYGVLPLAIYTRPVVLFQDNMHKMQYIRHNQDKPRANTYSGLHFETNRYEAFKLG